jgi:hypothetical protein
MAANPRPCRRSWRPTSRSGYPVFMPTLNSPRSSRRKALSAALDRVLAPSQLTAARELLRAENPGRPAPRPEDILYWMRVNMPGATRRVESILGCNE